MENGVILKYDFSRGFGFIRPDTDPHRREANVFFHHSALQGFSLVM